jgi:hypothetical protein
VGPTGAQGFQGSQGALGAQGSQGALGAQGSQGAQGSAYSGPSAPTGAQGAQGLRGAQGIEGAQGAKGGVGPTGALGFAGAQGSTGGQGAQGAQGAPGPPGPSDYRLKKNIELITNSIKKISKIRGVRYTWKNTPFSSDKDKKGDDIGFIAQELKEVLPEVVFGNEDIYYRVKYPDIIALCIEAIKEQSALLDIKEKKLHLLEEKAKEKGLI